ncbi:MAG: TetR/AcrR family transcriptional regulator [Desulfobacterales bacterium]|nr:TetR/AcrR family transcriptional regulator [Desulfobacterales bacterium]
MGRKSKSDVRKPEIIRHLMEVLVKEGLEKTTFAKVGDHMGVHPSLLVHYFKTKDEMMMALVDHMIDTYNNAYLTMFGSIEDPEKRLNEFVNRVLGVEWEIDQVHDYVMWACFYMALRNKRVHKRLKKLYDFILNLYINEIQGFKDAGIIKVENVEYAAVHIYSLSEGIFNYFTVEGVTDKVVEYCESMKKTTLKLLKNGTF